MRMMRNAKRLQLFGMSSPVLIAMTLAALMMPQTVLAHANGSPGNRSDPKNFQHVFIIMMENTGIASLIHNPHAPVINSLAASQGLATDYFGVTHPSQPNYIAATSGSTNGVPDDNDITINVPNIVDQLSAAGKTWRDYQQSLALCGGNKFAHACGNQLYERKHN